MNMKNVNQTQLLNACRRLVALNEKPEPGLGSWNQACCNEVVIIKDSFEDDDDHI